MPGQLSQVDIIEDGSPDPDLFVQVRFPTGEAPSGKIWLYGRDGNTLQVRNYGEIDMATTPAAVVLSNIDGFDYYAFDVALAFPTRIALDEFLQAPQGPTEKLNTTALTANTGDNFADLTSVLVFGDKNSNSVGNATYVDGPLAGQTIGDITDPPAPFIEGGDYFQDANPGPFIIDEDGNVVVGPSDPNSPCFLEGTLIATPDGEQPVETLRPGDLVLTQGGAFVEVRWVGRKTIVWPFRPVERLMPVRFAAGSLGEGAPHSDLTVTADHAMLVEGLLCQAGALVNGTTITRVTPDESSKAFTVYHIETEAHELIFANGVLTETFFDGVTRQVFDNGAEYTALSDVGSEVRELPLPRITNARQVPFAIRNKLASPTAA